MTEIEMLKSKPEETLSSNINDDSSDNEDDRSDSDTDNDDESNKEENAPNIDINQNKDVKNSEYEHQFYLVESKIRQSALHIAERQSHSSK